MSMNAIAKVLTDYDNPRSFGSRLRAKRAGPLIELIAQVYSKYGFVNIIDIGGAEQYWNIIPVEVLEKNKVNITIVNIPELKKPNDHGFFRFMDGDGCDLAQFEDKSFHIAHSNSVIEHVGDWSRMLSFSGEIRRISENYFVQTPNYWFPIEPHCMFPFFHWLPRPICVALVRRFQLGQWKRGKDVSDAVTIVESARLISREMFRALFPESKIITERFFLLPKSLVAVKREN